MASMQLAESNMSRHILLVEDDPDIARMSVEVLHESGFEVSSVGSAREMDAALERAPVDLILLDVVLPGEDGFSICRRLRSGSTVPIVMLSACREDSDRIVGLELGADDYVVKPFNSRELIARIRALLRRTQMQSSKNRRARSYTFSGWSLDTIGRQLRDPEGVRVPMTSVEIDMLAAFCRHAGQVLSREHLLELVHGGSVASIERSIDVHVSRIRQKIESDPKDPQLIRTVRLGGYIFTPHVEEL
jgi:two-component system, OmpR family, response regulator